MTDHQSLDAIWADDRIGRMDEAALVANYIEGASEQARIAPNRGALTLAIDGDYGIGKTFFLRKLADQLALSHPVAFVDAWADDLADQPLTALVATLKRAIEPLTATNEPLSPIAGRLRTVMEKSGKVAQIAGIGMIKRAAGLIITAGAVEVISDLFSGLSEDVQDSLKDGSSDLGEDAITGIQDLAAVKPLSLMEERVATFEAGQAAIAELKAGLRSLVAALDASSLKPPIVIVIDELDRCRPTYAIKLLEEIKHLFDVPGLAFVFGMHTAALSASVRAAYGADFNGGAYLKRFVQRKYALAEKPRVTLIQEMLREVGLSADDFLYPHITSATALNHSIELHHMIDAYARAYDVSARDIQTLVDMLATSVAIANAEKLYLPYLLPLAIGHLKQLGMGELPAVVHQFPWEFLVNRSRGVADQYQPFFLARDIKDIVSRTSAELSQKEDLSPLERLVLHSSGHTQPEPITSIRNYPRLLTMVSAIKRSN